MAVTKRIRFEIFRRDKHTCQYCGAKAPEVKIEIDHIIPASLGGDDKPGNLVTACHDCNSGKTSISPDSPLVEGLSDRAAAYALGMQDKMTRLRADFENADEFIEKFDEEWGRWNIVGEAERSVPLPPDYQLSLFRWSQMGIPFRGVEMAIPKAMMKTGIRGEFGVFQYMAGIVWSMFESREIDTTVTDETAAVYTEREAGDIHIDGYSAGVANGISRERGAQLALGMAKSQDFVQMHIDGRTSRIRELYMEGGTPPWQGTAPTSELISGTTMTSVF